MKDYKKILEGLVNIINNTEKSDIGFANICTFIGENCPELKESEDERIRKEILNYIDKVTGCKRWVAWLEKQGQTFTKKDIDDAYLKGVCDAKIELEKQGEQNHCMIQWKGDNLKEVIDFTGKDKNFEKWFKSFEEYEKYVQEHDGIFKLFNADGSHYEVPVGAWIVKTPDGYNVASKAIFRQKSVDTPKFKVGDWVIDKQGIVHQVANVVENVTNHTYGYDIVGGGYFNDNAEGVRLWNISDAKDCDVLVNGSNTFVFHCINDTRLMGYCHVNTNDGRFYDDIGKNEYFCLIDAVVNPATKEQCDTLMKAMADAGYAFDFEKKELKEIEYEPNKCEGCNNVKGCIACVDGSEWAHIEEQKPTEWNEGDESNFQGIIDELKANKHHAPDSDLLTYDRFLSWFKSLKERYVWKPNDEQMEVLSVYANINDVLASLYLDLKKLKG